MATWGLTAHIASPFSALETASTPEGLRVRECPTCGGRWVRSDDYWRWRAHATEPWPTATDDAGFSTHEPEPTAFRFCPEDNYLLTRYQVGPPHSFSIDQCRSCSGIWLDAGEWEALMRGGLAIKLRSILSQAWQDEIRAAPSAESDEERWRGQLALADLERITEIKAWLDRHPKRNHLYAYLRSKDTGH